MSIIIDVQGDGFLKVDKVDFSVDIEGPCVVGEMVILATNVSTSVVEANMKVVLASNFTVYKSSYEINGLVTEMKTKKEEEANQLYEDSISAGKTVSIAERISCIDEIYSFNIAHLQVDAKVLFKVSVIGKPPFLNMDLKWKSFDSEICTIHSPNGDILRFGRANEGVYMVDADRGVAVVFPPKTETAFDILFAIDRSESMGTVPMNIAKLAVLTGINICDKQTGCAVCCFDHIGEGVTKDGLSGLDIAYVSSSDDKRFVKNEIKKITSRGSTNINSINKFLMKADIKPIVVLITDGQPTSPFIPVVGVSYYILTVGEYADIEFARKYARLTGGHTVHAGSSTDVQKKMNELMKLVKRTASTNVKILVDNVPSLGFDGKTINIPVSLNEFEVVPFVCSPGESSFSFSCDQLEKPLYLRALSGCKSEFYDSMKLDYLYGSRSKPLCNLGHTMSVTKASESACWTCRSTPAEGETIVHCLRCNEIKCKQCFDVSIKSNNENELMVLSLRSNIPVQGVTKLIGVSAAINEPLTAPLVRKEPDQSCWLETSSCKSPFVTRSRGSIPAAALSSSGLIHKGISGPSVSSSSGLIHKGMSGPSVSSSSGLIYKQIKTKVYVSDQSSGPEIDPERLIDFMVVFDEIKWTDLTAIDIISTLMDDNDRESLIAKLSDSDYVNVLKSYLADVGTDMMYTFIVYSYIMDKYRSFFEDFSMFKDKLYETLHSHTGKPMEVTEGVIQSFTERKAW
jgi:hypothetical protein